MLTRFLSYPPISSISLISIPKRNYFGRLKCYDFFNVPRVDWLGCGWHTCVQDCDAEGIIPDVVAQKRGLELGQLEESRKIAEGQVGGRRAKLKTIKFNPFYAFANRKKKVVKPAIKKWRASSTATFPATLHGRDSNDRVSYLILQNVDHSLCYLGSENNLPTLTHRLGVA